MGINNEREVTNKCFKGKMAEIISVLNGSPYTPSPATNDNETLNCSTVEYYMDILKENVGSKENKGKITIGGVENSVVTHALSVTDSETTTTYTLLGV